MADDSKSECCPRGDVIVPLCPVPGGIAVLRHRADHEVEAGFLSPVREGQDLTGRHVVGLSHREGETAMDVRAEFVAGAPGQGRPALVNSGRFRDGWDRTFGSRAN